MKTISILILALTLLSCGKEELSDFYKGGVIRYVGPEGRCSWNYTIQWKGKFVSACANSFKETYCVGDTIKSLPEPLK